MLESLQKAEAVLRWWLVEYRVRSQEEVTKMTLSDIRSTFLAEVTDGSHRGYLRAWTIDVNDYSPQFPIQGYVQIHFCMSNVAQSHHILRTNLI